MKCPVCEGETAHLFSLPVMEKYMGEYMSCSSCGSLSLRDPHWLNEAYSSSHLTLLDVGALHRGMNTWAGTRLIMDIWGFTEALDWGTGDGLLPRFLRDRGLNGYGEDKWSPRTHCRAFTPPPGWEPQIITAWEVWEHWTEPRRELEELWRKNPQVHLFSTTLWRGQGPNWEYLAPTEGQHVTFYSEQGLIHLAKRQGLRVCALGPDTFIMFQDTPHNMLRAQIAASMWTGWKWDALRGALLNSPAPGIGRDSRIVMEGLRGK